MINNICSFQYISNYVTGAYGLIDETCGVQLRTRFQEVKFHFGMVEESYRLPDVNDFHFAALTARAVHYVSKYGPAAMTESVMHHQCYHDVTKWLGGPKLGMEMVSASLHIAEVAASCHRVWNNGVESFVGADTSGTYSDNHLLQSAINGNCIIPLRQACYPPVGSTTYRINNNELAYAMLMDARGYDIVFLDWITGEMIEVGHSVFEYIDFPVEKGDNWCEAASWTHSPLAFVGEPYVEEPIPF